MARETKSGRLEHYNGVTWTPKCIKSLVIPLFVQSHIQANNKENNNVPYCRPFVRGIHQWSVDSDHKYQQCGKGFHDHRINMLHGLKFVFKECLFKHLYTNLVLYRDIITKVRGVIKIDEEPFKMSYVNINMKRNIYCLWALWQRPLSIDTS